ncbi:MAG TPA: DUF4214 domain-containing protein, partial [Acidimicrobiales bacterium]|nr:DUF4214 domain-containing protein [Acidimicrobiales bacterium]
MSTRSWARPAGLLVTALVATTLSVGTGAAADGTGRCDPVVARADQVARLYEAAFDRAADAGGLAYWVGRRDAGVSLGRIAAWFVTSPEQLARYGALSDQGFVEQLYRNVLDREGDAGGIAHWSGALADGRLTRGGVLLGFSESAEMVARTGTLPPSCATSPSVADVRAARVYAFDCGDDEATVAAAGGPRVRIGDTTIYAGTRQVSATNQDPRLARFDAGQLTWCRTDLETTGDDGRGYGLLWDGGDGLYVVVSATGTQGAPGDDLRRVAGGGWLRHYADASTGGGGARVAVVARVDPATGAPTRATFLTARLSSGKVNSLVVTGLARDGADLVVQADSWFSPRRADRSPMTCSGGSPFAATYRFAADL